MMTDEEADPFCPSHDEEADPFLLSYDEASAFT